MDFFESQNKARKKTTLLLFLFTLAVLSLVALTNLLVFALINMQDTAGLATGRYHYSVEIFLMIGAGVISLIILASLFKLYSLKGGGSAVAEMLGGELLVDAGGDLNRKKLLNVVEEMAIASGTPVPPVYLIRESAINAFAAGYSPSDAVIGEVIEVTEAVAHLLDALEARGGICCHRNDATARPPVWSCPGPARHSIRLPCRRPTRSTLRYRRARLGSR